jgi:insulysin
MEEFTNFLPYQPIDNFDEPSCYLLKCKTDSIIHGYAENPEEVDGALINAYCVGYSHDRDTIMRCALVQSILEEKAFDELRTKQQLGYMVMLGQSTVGRVSTLTMRIESELPPWEVDDAVEEFFEDNDLTFVNMSDEDLEDYKTALANALLEAFTCMDDQIGYNWKGIDDGQLGFKLYKVRRCAACRARPKAPISTMPSAS